MRGRILTSSDFTLVLASWGCWSLKRLLPPRFNLQDVNGHEGPRILQGLQGIQWAWLPAITLLIALCCSLSQLRPLQGNGGQHIPTVQA